MALKLKKLINYRTYKEIKKNVPDDGVRHIKTEVKVYVLFGGKKGRRRDP